MIVNVSGCEVAWPNAQKCVRIDFSIRLKSLANSTVANNNGRKPTALNDSSEAFELNLEALTTMWVRFGRKQFADNGYNVLDFYCQISSID